MLLVIFGKKQQNFSYALREAKALFFPPLLSKPILRLLFHHQRTFSPNHQSLFQANQIILLQPDGRWYPRLVKKDGRIQVDGTSYSIKASLAGHRIMLRLNAATRCFDVFFGDRCLKSVPIKGLQGEQMPLEEYIDLMRERARSEERQRMLKQRRARLQGGQSA